MIVRCRLFAAARDLAGGGQVELELPEPATIGDLRVRLAAQFPALAPLAPHLMFAIDADYVTDRTRIPPAPILPVFRPSAADKMNEKAIAPISRTKPTDGCPWVSPASAFMIELTTTPIDTQTLLARVSSPAAGAVVLFLGTVREMTGGRRTAQLEYEAYGPMAEKKLAELAAEARVRWPLVGCEIVHRLGRLELGEVSVAVAVSSPHRADAFEAGRWLIDSIKQVVPIWKKELWADGESEWVHPGIESGAESASQATAAARRESP